MKKLQLIDDPVFIPQLKCWVFGGYTFQAKSGKKFAFYQIFDIFGRMTDFSAVTIQWKVFLIKENDSLEEITNNGIDTDSSSLKRRADQIGLSSEEIDILLEDFSSRILSKSNFVNIFTQKLEPMIEKKISMMQKTLGEMETLNEDELVRFKEEVCELLMEIKLFYPRSYEKLLAVLPKIKRRYAKIKYPELYSELKKVHKNKEYKHDDNDRIMCFGPRIVFNSFSQIFSAVGIDSRVAEYGTPFEKRNGKSLFFND